MMYHLDINKKVLAKILSAVIRKKQTVLSCDANNIVWQDVVDQADRHNVTTLVHYFVIQNAEIQIPGYIMEALRKKSLSEILEQERNYLAFGEILRKLTGSNVSVITLKGLFLRNLYHESWLRTMCDYDILVRPEDLEKAAVILEAAGYKKAHSEDKHVVYMHPHFMRVELHKSLISSDRYKNLSEFEENVWKGVVPAKVCDVDVLTLDITDHAIYLVLHMATHIKSGGFGLRQLCDWVLFIEAYKDEIDWDRFGVYIESMGMEIFTRVLFETCRKYFGLETPQGWREAGDDLQEVADRLILDIFDSGVFGNDSTERIAANRMLYYTEGAEVKTPLQKVQTLLSLFFPRAEKLDVRFGYARKHRLLLPIAWLHRIGHTIVRRDMEVSEKTSVFRTNRAAKIYTERSLLLQQLDLLK
jgi:hypothetical protein